MTSWVRAFASKETRDAVFRAGTRTESSRLARGEDARGAQAEAATNTLQTVREWCSRILDCSGHVSEILDNALDLSKLEAGNLVLDNQPMNMHQLVHEVHELPQST